MKKAEAISILAASVRPREPKDRARYDEAVKMAIEALKCSETPKSSERAAETAQNTSSCAHENDLIFRKAAIEAIEKAKMAQTPDGEIYVAKYNAEMNIQLLPTVQPVLTCDGCQHNGYFKHDICRRCLRNMRDLYEPE